MISTVNTGEVYGRLFTDYDSILFEQSVSLFAQRQKAWGVDLSWFEGKRCLDAGCGGGRFVVALARLGALVSGIDISEEAVEAAQVRLLERGMMNADAQVASVLNVPYPDATFDYVLSSGVIHHTPDPQKAFKELTRVLKPGGRLFLSVYGKGGLKWFTNDVFRYSICKVIPFKVATWIFKMLGVPPNKRYNILDNLYVEYVYRYKESEIREWLKEAGYSNVRRLKFERYDYEHWRARLIHGEGWIQVFAEKQK